MFLQILPALFPIILGELHRFANGLITTGDNADHQPLRYTERWGAFAGIHNTQAAAGSRTQVEQASSTHHALRNGINQLLDVRNSQRYCISDRAILGVDVAQQFTRGHALEFVIV